MFHKNLNSELSFPVTGLCYKRRISEFRRIRALDLLKSFEGGVDEFENALEQNRVDRIK